MITKLPLSLKANLTTIFLHFTFAYDKILYSKKANKTYSKCHFLYNLRTIQNKYRSICSVFLNIQ